MSWIEWFYGGIVIILGASLGSFINVVVYRLPEGLSLINPPSRCPKCYTRLKPKDNIPIFGWLVLGGKCRYCASPIPPRYPLVELATAILFGLAFWDFGFTWASVGAFLFVPFLVVLGLIDFDQMILPNSLTMGGMLTGIVFQGVRGALDSGQWTAAWDKSLESLLSAFIGLFLFEAIRWVGTKIFKQDAMGGGDPKLAAMIGAWLGWQLMLVSGFLACLLGSIVGMSGIVLGKLGRKQQIPFGPFLVVGALLSLFWGEPLLNWYLSLLGA